MQLMLYYNTVPYVQAAKQRSYSSEAFRGSKNFH
jgi:hypothetical protein